MTLRYRFACLLLTLLALCPMLGAQTTAPATLATRPSLDLRFETGGAAAKVSWIAFAPDGKTVYAAGDDKALRIWDVTDPAAPKLKRVMRFRIGQGPEGMIYSGALSPDGKMLALGGFFGPSGDPYAHSVRLVDSATGEMIAVLKASRGTPFGLSFSPDGRWLACGNLERSMPIWDLRPGLSEGKWDQVDASHQMIEGLYWVNISTAFISNTRLISGGYDRSVRIYDLDEQGQWKLTSTNKDHRDKVRAVAASPDGKYFVSGGFDKTLRLWDAATGQFIRTLQEGEGVNSLVFLPDSKSILFGGGSGSARLLQIPEGKQVLELPNKLGTVISMAVTRDGRLAATSGLQGNDLTLWDLTSGKQLSRTVGAGREVVKAGFSPDGKQVAFQLGGAASELCLDLPQIAVKAADKQVQWQRSIVEQNGLSVKKPERSRVVTVREGQQVAVIQRGWGWDIIHCWGFVPGTGQLVVGSDFELTLHDAESGKVIREFVGHDAAIRTVAVSPDGRLLASGSDDQTMRLWNLQTGDLLLTVFATADNRWIALAPTGYYACSVGGDSLAGWQLNRGPEKSALWFGAERFRSVLNRPELLRKLMQTLSVNEVRRGGAAGPELLDLCGVAAKEE